ncbi:MAG: c-type cytochrome [Pseudomonadota bacterium]|jgi:cytochrome c556
MDHSLMSVRGLRAGLASAVLVLGAAGAVQAQTAEQAINYRKGVMQVQAWHFGPLVQMVKNARPFDAALVARNAAVLESTGRMVVEGFTPGSDAGNTRALPAIWKDAAGFKAAADRFTGDAAKLVAVARSGDEKATRAQIAEVARHCGSCHDNFRAK